MPRRPHSFGLVVGCACACAVVSGCWPVHKAEVRQAEQETRGNPSGGASAEPPVFSWDDAEKSVDQRQFFKPNRLSGAWSSEGREIERDFNIE